MLREKLSPQAGGWVRGYRAIWMSRRSLSRGTRLRISFAVASTGQLGRRGAWRVAAGRRGSGKRYAAQQGVPGHRGVRKARRRPVARQARARHLPVSSLCALCPLLTPLAPASRPFRTRVLRPVDTWDPVVKAFNRGSEPLWCGPGAVWKGPFFGSRL